MRNPKGKFKVLFICIHNSARSQMAEGFLRAIYPEHYQVYSAGLEPRGVHPLAIQVMREKGIDISSHTSKSVEVFRGEEFDLVVSVCEAQCPVFFNAKRLERVTFPDPSKRGTLEAFREVRDMIERWIRDFFHPEKIKKFLEGEGKGDGSLGLFGY